MSSPTIEELAAEAQSSEQQVPDEPVIRRCKLCDREILIVRNADAGKPAYLDRAVPAYVVYRDTDDRQRCRTAGAWLAAAIDRAPPAAAAMAAFDVEVNAPTLEAVEAVEAVYVPHEYVCPVTIARRQNEKTAAKETNQSVGRNG